MKHWTHELEQHVARWSRERPEHPWLPGHVYHFTDVQNAAAILNCGTLLSRAEAERRGVIYVDQASPEIIEATAAAHHEYARLYFAPQTPTQFCNEGIRAPAEIQRSAHCPVPVFLCFDFVQLLRRDAAQFSNGNMASVDVDFGNSLELFRRIPFEDVYARGPMSSEPARKKRQKFHRHAEVLIPRELKLDASLKMIVCRSPAERQTLLYLLSSNARLRWANRIRIGYETFFFRRWTYVDTVHSQGEHIVFSFINGAGAKFTFTLGDLPGHKVITGTLSKRSLRILFRKRPAAAVTLRIWDVLAFQGKVRSTDEPF